MEPRAGTASGGAVVALHGCGGLYDRNGNLSARHRAGAERLVREGFVVLLPDSFGSRGLREVCTQRYARRHVDIAQRRLDALAAHDHLVAKRGHEASRIAVLGWSNGATTVLASIAETGGRPIDDSLTMGFARAVAFYPGCGAALRQSLQPTVPTLLLLGAEDDWTPAEPCLQWARRVQGPGKPAVEFEVYAGAHHGFDGPGSRTVRRTDVPNAPDGKGVTVGGSPEARERSWRRVLEWLAPLRD
jgi:dienelactone hydrolase